MLTEVTSIRRTGAVGACVGVLLLGGCGGKAAVTSRPTATPPPARHTPTATSVTSVSATPVPTDSTVTTTPTAVASATAATATAAPTRTVLAVAPAVQSASVRPHVVGPGDSIQLQAQVSGAISEVQVYLSAGPGTGAPVTYTLGGGKSGSWTGSGTAPTSPGTYFFSVGLYDFNGKQHVVSNDGWSVQVTGGASAGNGTGAAGIPTPTQAPSAVQPLPANIPLAPPFSYGNPVAATFNAEGRSIHGSEVVSNSRPDVAASTVSQFYAQHLPRAGWNVDPTTIPGPGAQSFTIVASSGGQICVVQYGGGTVQIFYGTAPS